MNAMHQLMVRRSTPRRAVVAYVVAVVALGGYLLYVARLDALIGWGGKLDLRPGGYGPADVDELFADLGSDGRSLYIRTTVGDTIWPLLAGLSALLTAPLAARARWAVLILGLAPMAFGLIDLIENIGVIYLLVNHPDVSTKAVAVTSAVTQIKLLAVLPLAFVAWLCVPVLALRRPITSRTAIQLQEEEFPVGIAVASSERLKASLPNACGSVSE